MPLGETLRYVYDGLSDSYDDPFWWRERLCEFGVGPFHTAVYPRRTGSIDVPSADWDTLVVLDACREDLFAERADTTAYDEYRTVTSKGSTTREWVRQNFAGRELGDVVYVTANPYVSQEAGGCFHHLEECWATDFDQSRKTVPPDAVVDAAIDAHATYSDKRIVVHLMQPHHPFIGEHELSFSGWQIEGESHDGDANERPYTPWDALWLGAVDHDDLWRAYGDNLSLALDEVDRLLDAISGKVVLTSDHGNMLGERCFPVPFRVYGHPKGVRCPQLVDVPWAVLQRGDRRHVTREAARSTTDSEREEIEDRLADLGYR